MVDKGNDAEAQNNHKRDDVDDICTISQKRYIPTPTEQYEASTANIFDILVQNDCLPTELCNNCLTRIIRKKIFPCGNFCRASVEKKFLSSEFTVRPPHRETSSSGTSSRNPFRLIPRIIHQTYFENVTKEKYPKMSQLVESFNQSGWKYMFYTDDDARKFISVHFSFEILEAYDALIPGAFKADLFRYCVLLIYGGVYADVDVMLETKLDLAIDPDVGFMVSSDKPGAHKNHTMCLWNGFMAAAPGHPFMAKVIEMVVNIVRNRCTIVDIAHLFCPDPDFGLLKKYAYLFITGPCILGAAINSLLGRPGQTSFEPGELAITWRNSKGIVATANKTEHQTRFFSFPGRTVILHQKKRNMFTSNSCYTLLKKKLKVFTTDIKDVDREKDLEKSPHYYKTTRAASEFYGLEQVYVEDGRANEELRFFVDGGCM